MYMPWRSGQIGVFRAHIIVVVVIMSLAVSMLVIITIRRRWHSFEIERPFVCRELAVQFRVFQDNANGYTAEALHKWGLPADVVLPLYNPVVWGIPRIPQELAELQSTQQAACIEQRRSYLPDPPNAEQCTPMVALIILDDKLIGYYCATSYRRESSRSYQFIIDRRMLFEPIALKQIQQVSYAKISLGTDISEYYLITDTRFPMFERNPWIAKTHPGDEQPTYCFLARVAYP